MQTYSQGTFVTQGQSNTPESQWVVVSAKNKQSTLPLEVYYINRASGQCMINTNLGVMTTPSACTISPMQNVTWGSYASIT